MNTKDVYTDKFMIHKVRLGENIGTLASYYGTTVEQIVFDNQMSNQMIKEGGKIILRIPSDSPKMNASDVLPPLMFTEYTAEYKYRGPVCLYNCYVGDPINSGSGNYYHENTDVKLSDYKEIELKRYYNSLGEIVTTEFGNGFTSNYNQFVFYGKEEHVYYFSGDGKVYQFRKTATGYEKDLDNPYNLSIKNNKIELVEEKTKQIFEFNENGTLDRIVELNGHYTQVLYNDYAQIEKLNIDGIKEVLFKYNAYNFM